MIRLHGDNNIFRDNTIITDLSDDTEAGDAPGSILKLYYCRRSKITNNKVYDRATTRNPLLLHLYSAKRNAVRSNYFWSSLPRGSRSADKPALWPTSSPPTPTTTDPRAAAARGRRAALSEQRAAGASG